MESASAVLLVGAARRDGARFVAAELQRWTVNVETAVADCQQSSHYRQVGERDKPLRVGPLADELAQAVTNRRDDPRLKWYADGTVRVLVTSFVKGLYKQTEVGRRQRFRAALDRRLDAAGWRKLAGKLDRYENANPPK